MYPMTDRNLSPFEYFQNLASSHKPRHTFTGKTSQDVARWKRTLLPKVLATLGHRPQKVPMRPKLLAQWQEDGLVKQRWVIDVQPKLSATLLVFRPNGLAKGERRPAILCCHGHGQFGKDSVMGLRTDSARTAEIDNFNYDYGLQMAHAGFVTYALDWLGFGERHNLAKPSFKDVSGQRDPCNIHYLCASLLGSTVLAMNCHDASCATDFVTAMPFVDPKRLGVMGLSYGGTMTTWMMLTDSRFIAADVICYAGPFSEIAYRTHNICGSQITPGLFELCDVSDLQGLIAPKPLLVELGVHDNCFLIDHALNQNYHHVQRIYRAAGATDKLQLDLFANEHRWGGNKSVDFFSHTFSGK